MYVLFFGANLRSHLAHGITETDGQHGLTRILQDIYDLLRRSLQIKGAAVGEQVVSGGAADGVRQALAELPLQKTHDLAHALQRESAAAQFTDDSDFGQIFHGIEATVAFARGNHNAALIPPLQLAWRDAGEIDHFPRCKLILHLGAQNVSNNCTDECLKHFRLGAAGVNSPLWKAGVD